MQKLLLLFIIIVSIGCSKTEVETVNEVIDTNNAKILYTGQFMNGSSYSTKGTLTITQSSDGKRMVNMMNLMSDNGPDLRLYLAENKEALNFKEIDPKFKNGTYSIEIPNDIDFAKHKFILVWCKRFSALFGSAELSK
ncbi:MAG: DM13 domain-containing protein [Saprospiraceae bacterium]|jgi:lipopolysaccharide export system protein LptC|nr:DM13 domain-containing protein [Saprospiraceae bacterium]